MRARSGGSRQKTVMKNKWEESKMKIFWSLIEEISPSFQKEEKKLQEVYSFWIILFSTLTFQQEFFLGEKHEGCYGASIWRVMNFNEEAADELHTQATRRGNSEEKRLPEPKEDFKLFSSLDQVGKARRHGKWLRSTFEWLFTLIVCLPLCSTTRTTCVAHPRPYLPCRQAAQLDFFYDHL